MRTWFRVNQDRTVEIARADFDLSDRYTECTEEYAAKIQENPDLVLPKDPNPSQTLKRIKERSKAAIDQEAEQARQKWITQGDGQAQEYAQTRAEAEAYQTSQPTGTYPMLEAEVKALTAVGQTVTLDAVAAAVKAEIVALDIAMAAIKAHRREGKLKVSAAANAAAVASAQDAAITAIQAVPVPS